MQLFKKFKEKKLIQNLCIDFVEGGMSSAEFWKKCLSNIALRNALICNKRRVTIYGDNSKIIVPKNFEKKQNEKFFMKFNINNFGHRYRLFCLANCYLMSCNIYAVNNNKEAEMYMLLYEPLPEWVSVNDVEHLLKIYNNLPKDLSKTNKAKAYKEKVLELFKYDKQPPQWIQEPEWPVVNNVPYVFDYQETTEDGIEMYYFYNPHSKEQIVVEQFE